MIHMLVKYGLFQWLFSVDNKNCLVCCLDDLTGGLRQTDSAVNESHCKRHQWTIYPQVFTPGIRARVWSWTGEGMGRTMNEALCVWVWPWWGKKQGQNLQFSKFCTFSLLVSAVITCAGYLNSPKSRQITSKPLINAALNDALSRFEVD